MRVLGPALALALAGCLSAPTGTTATDAADTTWPPPGQLFRAIAGGKVDGDSQGDLIAVAPGSAGGLYLLRGGVDLDANGGASHYSAFRGVEGLVPPIAVTIALSRVFVVDAGGGGTLRVFDATLTPIGSPIGLNGAAVIAGNARITLHPEVFFGGATTVMYGLPGRLGFIEMAGATPTPRAIMDAAVPALDDAPLAIGGWTGGIIVASLTTVHAAPMPGTPGAFAFEQLRVGSPWIAQTTGDVPIDAEMGNGVPDVIGFDPAGTPGQLCVQQNTGAVAATCDDFSIEADTNVSLVYEDFGGNAAPRDLAILESPPPPGLARIWAASNLKVTAGAIDTTVMGPLPLVDVRGAMMTAVPAPTGPAGLFVMSEDGALRCYRLGGTMTPCQL